MLKVSEKHRSHKLYISQNIDVSNEGVSVGKLIATLYNNCTNSVIFFHYLEEKKKKHSEKKQSREGEDVIRHYLLDL